MIHYHLLCETEHAFDAWFGSSSAFDTQAKRGLVECPRCGSTTVRKAIMAPRLGTKGNRKSELSGMKAANLTAAEQAPSFEELRAVLRRIRAEVEEKSEYVGDNFAEEARRIHHEETPARGIYGEATAADAQALVDEGIEFYPLPRLPEEQN
jgi:hypothetical protein